MNLRVCALTLSALLALVASPATAQPEAAKPLSAEEANALAKKYMAEGSVRFAKRDFDGAYEALLKAWEVKRHVAIATNLVEVEMKLGRYVDAAERARAAITEFELHRKEDADVLFKHLDECRPHVLALNITVNVSGATVKVDRRVVGLSPLVMDVFVLPGSESVSAELNGYELATATVGPTKVGDRKEIQLNLTSVAAHSAPVQPTAVVASTPAEHAPSNTARTVVLVSGAVLTVAAATVGVVYAGKRSDYSDEAERLKDEVGVGGCAPGGAVDDSRCETLKTAWSNYDRAGNLMTGAFVGAGVLGAATIATYLLWPVKKAPSTTQARTTISPWALGTGAGLQLAGSF
jgi:hypothetical protein